MTFCGTTTDDVSAATTAEIPTLPPSEARACHRSRNTVSSTQRHRILLLVTDTINQ